MSGGRRSSGSSEVAEADAFITLAWDEAFEEF